MTDINPPTPKELAQIRTSTGMTSDEFGQAIGYSDAARTIRALEKGERHGKPYLMSGTATRSMRYMLALKTMVDAHQAHRDEPDSPDKQARLVDAIEAAIAALPNHLRPKE